MPAVEGNSGRLGIRTISYRWFLQVTFVSILENFVKKRLESEPANDFNNKSLKKKRCNDITQRELVPLENVNRHGHLLRFPGETPDEFLTCAICQVLNVRITRTPLLLGVLAPSKRPLNLLVEEASIAHNSRVVWIIITCASTGRHSGCKEAVGLLPGGRLTIRRISERSR